MKPYLFILIVISAFLLFFSLGNRPLLSSGEARASEIACEMMQSGNYLIPHLNEEVLLTKPPLFHWIIIMCYKMFGVAEFVSRIPSALSGMLVVVLVYFLGLSFWPSSVEKGGKGFIAGLLLLTSPLFFWSARCARIDCMLLFYITAALFCFWKGYKAKLHAKLWFLGWFLFMGLGTLAKGPVGIAVPLITVLLFLMCVRKLYVLKKLNWLWGLLLFSLIVFPWYAIIYFIVPPTKSGLFFVQQNQAWFSGGGEWYKGYVYFVHLFLGFLPWSIALPTAFYVLWKDIKLKRDETKIFLGIWFIVVFFIFFFFGKKVSRYILPLYPAIALITADIIGDRKTLLRSISFVLTGLWIFIIVGINTLGLYKALIDPELFLIIQQHISICNITLIGLLIIVLGIYGIRRRRLIYPVLISIFTLLMFIQYVIPVEKDYYSPKPFCIMLQEVVSDKDELYAYKSWDNTIRYYYGKHVDIIRSKDELLGLIDLSNSPEYKRTEGGGKIYFFMWDDVYEELPAEIKGKTEIVQTGYKVMENKVVLICNSGL